MNIAFLSIGMQDLTVVATSITLVFCMLAVLCLIITVEGKIFDSMNAKKAAAEAAKKAAEAEKAAAAAPAAAPAAQPAPAPVEETGIPGGVIAAISGAVAYLLGSDAQVTGVSLADEQPAKKERKNKAKTTRRGAWGDAGVNEHTRPFM